jgi:hypothetical protein
VTSPLPVLRTVDCDKMAARVMATHVNTCDVIAAACAELLTGQCVTTPLRHPTMGGHVTIRSTSRIEHVMDCILNQAKSRTELIHTIHTNIQESFPSWKALGIPFIAHAHCFAGKARSRSHTTATCYTTFQKHQPFLLLPMLTNIRVVLHFLKNDQCGINIHGDQEFRPIDAGKR